MTDDDAAGPRAGSSSVLDEAARRLVEGARFPPFLYAMGPHDARLALGLMQAPPDEPDDVEHRVVAIETGHGPVTTHVLRPRGVPAASTVLYAHGGGWMVGGYETHHRMAVTLCREARATVVMPLYSRVPEARYPVAIEQLTAVLDRIVDRRAGRVALVGDCAGATMALAVALARRDADIAGQVLLYPLGVPGGEDASAIEYATGAALRLADVRRLCREYAPRRGPLADPLDATDLHGLPPTLLITAEADVTRDKAERFAVRLRAAGVSVTAVRYLGTVHDFAVLDALRWTPSAQAAIAQVACYLRGVL